LSAALKTPDVSLIAVEGKRSRRSWSAEEKQRIVEEASRPGASVADIARYHGLNANLVFNWRKTALVSPGPTAPEVPTPSEMPSTSAPLPAAAPPTPPDVPTEFIPIGVFGRADDEGPGLVARPSPVSAPASANRMALPRPSMDERPGVIEIDLADGTRLRVDAFVNERALRRVMSALKAVS
jgi:transposase